MRQSHFEENVIVMISQATFRHCAGLLSGPVEKWFILFHPVACSKLLRKAHRTADNVEVVIFQPTMSSQRMVVGNILTGTLPGFHIVRNV